MAVATTLLIEAQRYFRVIMDRQSWMSEQGLLLQCILRLLPLSFLVSPCPPTSRRISLIEKIEKNVFLVVTDQSSPANPTTTVASYTAKHGTGLDDAAASESINFSKL